MYAEITANKWSSVTHRCLWDSSITADNCFFASSRSSLHYVSSTATSQLIHCNQCRPQWCRVWEDTGESYTTEFTTTATAVYSLEYGVITLNTSLSGVTLELIIIQYQDIKCNKLAPYGTDSSSSSSRTYWLSRHKL